MTSSDAQSERPVPVGYPAIVARGDALEALEQAMASDPTLEAGGVLVGNAAPSTNFVLITGSLPAQGNLRDTSFTFAPGELDALGAQVHQVFPGQRIVGWYHGHPNFGVFMSAHDVYIHSTYFAQPWTIAYVFDPVLGDRGFFGWANRELIRVPRWEVTSTSFSSSDLPAQAAPGDDDGDSLADEYDQYDDQDQPEVSDDVMVAIAESRAVEVDGGDEFPPPAVPDSEPVVEPAALKSGSNKGRVIAAVALAAVAAIVIGAIALNSGDDEPATTSPPTNPSVVDTSPQVTEPAATASSAAQDTTTSAAGDTSTSAGASVSVPPTPTSVTDPATRVGTGAAACEETAPGEYAPTTDCFVPLVNGNILSFTAGALHCVDPDNAVLVPEVQQFSVGVEDDPLAIVADDTLVPKCGDLTYVRNIIADGADTLDGLCGSSGTQINDATARCFGQNPTTGAIAAVVRGTADQNALVGACWSSTGDSDTTELQWTNDNVTTLWRIDAVSFDTAASNFGAAASRPSENATASASFDCS